MFAGGYGTGPNEQPFLMTAAAKRSFLKHERDFVLTSDFGRPYSSILSKSGRYVVENWVRWTEVFSTYLLCPEIHGGQQPLTPLAKKMWGLLRCFVFHHQRKVIADPADPAGQGSSYHPDTRAAAQAALLEYSKLLDTVSSGCPSWQSAIQVWG